MTGLVHVKVSRKIKRLWSGKNSSSCLKCSSSAPRWLRTSTDSLNSERRLETGKERNKNITQVVFVRYSSPLRTRRSSLESVVLTSGVNTIDRVPLSYVQEWWWRTVWNPIGGHRKEIEAPWKQKRHLFCCFSTVMQSLIIIWENYFGLWKSGAQKTCWPWASCLVAMTTQLVAIAFAASRLPESSFRSCCLITAACRPTWDSGKTGGGETPLQVFSPKLWIWWRHKVRQTGSADAQFWRSLLHDSLVTTSSWFALNNKAELNFEPFTSSLWSWTTRGGTYYNRIIIIIIITTILLF